MLLGEAQFTPSCPPRPCRILPACDNSSDSTADQNRTHIPCQHCDQHNLSLGTTLALGLPPLPFKVRAFGGREAGLGIGAAISPWARHELGLEAQGGWGC